MADLKNSCAEIPVSYDLLDGPGTARDLLKRGLIHPCYKCGRVDKTVTFEPDPYAADVEDDNTPVWECASCREESADDI